MGKPPILAAIAALLAFVGTVFVRDDPASVVWSADSGASVPEHFLYLLFPRRPDVPILDERDDRAIAPLGRAITGSAGQLRAGAFVSAWQGEQKGRVAAADLAYLPRSELAEDELGRWRETIAAWDTYDRPEATFQPSDDGETLVTLSTRYSSGREERFVYRTNGDSAEPIAWTRHAPGSAALGLLQRLAITALVACAAFASSRWWSRRSRRAAVA